MEKEVKDEFLKELVTDYINRLPQDKKEKLWDDLLRKIVTSELHHWDLDKIVTDQVAKHVARYIQNPKMQERLKKKAEEIAEKLCDGTFENVGARIERELKSEYGRVFKTK